MGRAHGTKRCAKRICCRSEKGHFAACSGRSRTGIFFSLHIYSSIRFFFYDCLDQWTQHDQTNIFFLSRNTTGGAFSPILARCKRPGGAISELFHGTPRGAFTPFSTICWGCLRNRSKPWSFRMVPPRKNLACEPWLEGGTNPLLHGTARLH